MPDPTTLGAGPLPGVATSLSKAACVEAPFADALVQLGRKRKNLVVLSADLSKYTDVAPFAAAFPERFFQVGMAEQNMIGIAGGLAKCDLVPVAVTYCVFATRRAGDQIQMALSTGGRSAVVAAFLPGITTPFRASHQGTDDLAIMRAVPGMTVLDPMDATELEAALAAAVERGGPVYLRGLRGSVTRVLDPPIDFDIGRCRLLREGGDVAFIGTGLGSVWALEASELLSARRIQAAVLHTASLKPFDGDGVAEFAAGYRSVVTVENHSVVGGLGSAVAEALAERGVGSRLVRRGVPDRWGVAGPVDYVRAALGLDAAALADEALKSVGSR